MNNAKSLNDPLKILQAASSRPEPVNRGVKLVDETVFQYKYIKQKITKDQSINLVCFIGQRKFDVYSLRPCKNDIICVSSKTDDGTVFAIFAPIEQISFSIEIYNKKTKEPAREIGFKAIWET